MGISAIGLGTSALTVATLISTWRIGPHAHQAHVVSIAGLQIAYPAANLWAIIVLLLALAGLWVTARVLSGAAHQLLAAHRFDRAVAGTGVTQLAGALVIDDPHPHAFCAGLARPRVYVTSGAIELLDPQALEAVLLHERHHAMRRDPLRLAAARVVARALFFLPWLRDLHGHELSFAELGADEHAVATASGSRTALARAMLSITDASAGGGVDPLRVDYLLGERPSWRLPASLWIAPLLTTGLIAVILLFGGRLAAGSASLGLPLLSSQPCILMLALIPAVAGRIAHRRTTT